MRTSLVTGAKASRVPTDIIIINTYIIMWYIILLLYASPSSVNFAEWDALIYFNGLHKRRRRRRCTRRMYTDNDDHNNHNNIKKKKTPLWKGRMRCMCKWKSIITLRSGRQKNKYKNSSYSKSHFIRNISFFKWLLLYVVIVFACAVIRATNEWLSTSAMVDVPRFIVPYDT